MLLDLGGRGDLFNPQKNCPVSFMDEWEKKQGRGTFGKAPILLLLSFEDGLRFLKAEASAQFEHSDPGDTRHHSIICPSQKVSISI